MLDSVLYFLWASDMGAQTYPDTPMTNQEAASFIDLIYETQDGYMTVAVMSNQEWIGLTQALEKPEWLGRRALLRRPARATSMSTSALLMTQEVLKTRTTAEWMRRLEAQDVPCAPALRRSEVIAHPQVVGVGTDRGSRSPRRRAAAPGALARPLRPHAFEHPVRRAAARASTTTKCWRNSATPSRRARSCAPSKIIGSESLRNKG